MTTWFTCTAPVWNLADPLSVSHLRIRGCQIKQNPWIIDRFPWKIARPHSALPFLFYLQAGFIAYIHYSFPVPQLCMQLVRLSSHLGQTWPTASTACSMFPAPCPHPSAGSVGWDGCHMLPSSCPAGAPGVPTHGLYQCTDWTRQVPELLVIAPQGYEILWQQITLPNTGCSISPCWSMSGSTVGIRALSIWQHRVSPGGAKLFYEDVCCLFSCQQIQGLRLFALPFIHCQLFLGSCFCSEFTVTQVSLATISHLWSTQVSNRAKLYCSIL